MKRLFCLVLLICVLSSCGKSEEEIFVARMKELSPTSSPMYVQVDDMNDMITATKSNCIVRCTVDKRDNTLVFDPFTGYTKEDLLSAETSEREKAVISGYISTPYRLTVTEVYLSGTLTEGDSFIFYAPYGEIGEYRNKLSGHPILEINREYLLFLRADKINGQLVYYLSYPPGSAVEIEKIDSGSLTASAQAVIDELTHNLETHDYDTSYDTVVSEVGLDD